MEISEDPKSEYSAASEDSFETTLPTTSRLKNYASDGVLKSLMVRNEYET